MDVLIPIQPELGRFFFLPLASVPTTKEKQSESEVVVKKEEERLLPEACKNEVVNDRKTIDISNC